MEKKPKSAKSKPAPRNKSKVATFQLEKLLDGLSDSFMALDTEWRYTYVNEQAAQILGRTSKQLIGKNIWTEFPEGVNQPFYKAYYKAVETHQPVFLEEYYPLTGRWFEKRIYPSAEGLVIFFHDITMRKKAEEILRVSESRYRRLVDADLIGIVIAGTDGRVMEANDFFLNLIGATEEELQAGKVRWDNITPPEWKEVDARAVEQLGATGISEPFEKEYFHRDGHRVPIRATIALLKETPGDGICIIEDLTEHKQAKQSLNESERRFREMLENIQLVAVSLDLDGRITFCNEYLLQISGFTRNEVVGWDWFERFVPEVRPDVKEIFLRGLKRGEIETHYENPIRTKSGGERFIRFNNTILRDTEGKVIGTTSLGEDITERKQAEEKLRLSEEKYRIVTEASHDSISLVNRQFEIEYTNLFAASQFETTPPELIGKRLEDLFPPQVAARQQANLQKVFDSEEPNYIEAIAVFKGQTVWLGSWLVPIRNDTNQVTSVLIVSRDITKRKQAEDDLRENENKLRTIFETMSEGVAQNEIIYDENGEMTDYRILEVNRAFYSTASYNEREVVGGLASQVYGMSHEFIRDFWRKHRTRDELLRTEMSSPIDNKWFYVSTSPFLNDKFVTTFFDITERKQAEEKLSESEERYRELFEAESDSIFLIENATGKIHDANSAATTLYGYTHDEFLSLRDVDLSAEPETIQEVTSGPTVTPGQTITIPLRYHRKKDGTIFAVEITGRFFNNRQGNLFRVAAMRDITERKQAEETIQQYAVDLERRVEERTLELVHANRAKDEFLANMSHELRTPLNAVLNISESLAEGVYGELQPRQSEVLRMVAESGHHLLSLIKDILDLSKIEAGKLELNVEPISVDLFCQSSMRMISQVAFLKHLQVSMSNTSNIETIYADERRLKQMLVNLLSNAVKFTPAGGQIGLEVSSEGDYAIRFSVWDSGIGIPADQLKKLFIPFVQLDSSLSRQYSGTGLGLSLVHDLAELHGGSVGVESNPGRGSRFYFIIPTQSINTSTLETTNFPAQLKPIEKTNDQNGENRRILLVEDNVVNLSVTRTYLIDKGYQVIEATDGLEAIEQARAQNPDLILMDIQMPVISGLEAIKRLRTMPEFDSVPIIALTALAMPGDRERCLKAGANEYVTKPVILKALMEMIEKLI